MHDDDIFLILADPSRRRIVEVLRDGERSVNDIVDALDIHQSGVSRICASERIGVVKSRPTGPSALIRFARSLFASSKRGWCSTAPSGRRGSIDSQKALGTQTKGARRKENIHEPTLTLTIASVYGTELRCLPVYASPP